MTGSRLILPVEDDPDHTLLSSNSYVQNPVQPGALHDRSSRIPSYRLDVNAPPPERTTS